MPARLTVVLEDEDLYRRAKIAAVERRRPLKSLVEEALRQYLEGETQSEPKEWDWDEYDRWQAEAAELQRQLGDSRPTDFSDVKKWLYSGWNSRGERGPEPEPVEGE
jgi:hypothetical protein